MVLNGIPFSSRLDCLPVPRTLGLTGSFKRYEWGAFSSRRRCAMIDAPSSENLPTARRSRYPCYSGIDVWGCNVYTVAQTPTYPPWPESAILELPFRAHRRRLGAPAPMKLAASSYPVGCGRGHPLGASSARSRRWAEVGSSEENNGTTRRRTSRGYSARSAQDRRAGGAIDRRLQRQGNILRTAQFLPTPIRPPLPR